MSRRGDLAGRPFPALPEPGPGSRREALERLRAWAEQEAEDAIGWYLADKRGKRFGSKAIRAVTVLLAVAGAAIPLGSAALGGPPAGWGYVLLALAAGCRGFDYFFGLSSGWMRSMTAAQALRAELDRMRLGWAAGTLRGDGSADPSDEEMERRLALIVALAGATRDRLAAETAEWLTEFRTATDRLQEAGPPLPGQAQSPPPAGS